MSVRLYELVLSRANEACAHEYIFFSWSFYRPTSHCSRTMTELLA